MNAIYEPMVRDLQSRVMALVALLSIRTGPLAMIRWIGNDLESEYVSDTLRQAANAFLTVFHESGASESELWQTYRESLSESDSLRSDAIALRGVILGFWTVSGEQLGIDEESYKEVTGLIDLETAIASIPRKGRTQGGATVTVESEASRIREWAVANGHSVGERGRIAQDVREAYAAAHPNS